MPRKLLLLIPCLFVVVLTRAQTTILDFETTETTTSFQYFGSTLDGTLNSVVANPNPEGENTSAMVANFVKPAVAEVWAGAYSNPNPMALIDLVSNDRIAIKVHMDHIGSLSLKLEQSTDGGDNWIITVPNTRVNEWETLIFDAAIPSIEAPNTPAAGHTYQRAVLFFDFGTGGTGVDVTYYFDDIVVQSTGAPATHVVHFAVDMNQYTENFDQVYVSGTFNNWSGEANPLADPEFDGIWEGDIEVVNGAYEYKVTLDNWAAQESFLGFEECIRRDPSGQFVNRLLLVSGDLEVPTFCYNSCYACGQEVELTFRFGMGEIPPNPDGVWLAGGGNFDIPGGKFKMQDDDGDGIYEITMPRAIGFSSFYTFTNGPCPDYSCKENLAGLPCGDPNNFNDRFLTALSADKEVATCFGRCDTNAECTVGTNDLHKNESVFALNGNPAVNGHSLLTFGESLNAEKLISITNILGQTLQHIIVGDGVSHFNLQTGDLNSGVYFITVTAGNQFYTRKLTK